MAAMDSANPDPTDPFIALVAWIERQLDEPLTLDRIAARAGGERAPASGLKLVDGPDFELYDGRFDPQKAGAVIDFHVPVEAR